MPDLLVEAKGLSKRYPGGVLAVSGLSLNVQRGEVYGFLGPNGAGKTTVLRMLVGLIRPTSGSAVVCGHTPGSPASLARVGSLIEAPTFWPYLSGRDNLRALARYCALPQSRVAPALAEVDLTTRAGRAFSTYSTGMKQRLGVAAALLKDPELLILDEPTNGLDPQGMAEFRELIKRLGSGHRTVLLSSHLLPEVEQICSRVGVISKGKLVAEGPIASLRGASSIVVRATPTEAVLPILKSFAGSGVVETLPDGSFSFPAAPDQAPLLATALAQAGVSLYELRPSERSLESVFIELTGKESGS